MSIIATIMASPIFLGGSGLIVTGLVSYWMKELPIRIFELLKELFTSSITFTSYNESFYDFLNYIEENYKDTKFKTNKVNNGKWGEGKPTMSFGYGIHYLKMFDTRVRISYQKEETKDRTDKEIITIQKIGRSKDFFYKLVDSIKKEDDKIKVFNFENECWDFCRSLFKRNWKSIFIQTSKKNEIIESIKDFRNKKEWYIENGIPYQIGFLLKGPPGSGKTSIIKAIASEFNFPIYYLSVSDLKDIKTAFGSLPDNCLVVLEDIDSNSVTHNRENKEDDEKEIGKKSITLSEILNSLDGLFSSSGRVLVMTTNHPEVLDPALIRPGRIDKILEIGFVDNEILKQFIDNFFPDNNIDVSELKLKEITTSELQGYVLSNKTLEFILNEVIV